MPSFWPGNLLSEAIGKQCGVKHVRVHRAILALLNFILHMCLHLAPHPALTQLLKGAICRQAREIRTGPLLVPNESYNEKKSEGTVV